MNPYKDLKRGMLYRIVYNAEPQRIAGKPVMFLSYIDVGFYNDAQILRAQVRIPALNETWLVTPHNIIAF